MPCTHVHAGNTNCTQWILQKDWKWEKTCWGSSMGNRKEAWGEHDQDCTHAWNYQWIKVFLIFLKIKIGADLAQEIKWFFFFQYNHSITHKTFLLKITYFMCIYECLNIHMYRYACCCCPPRSEVGTRSPGTGVTRLWEGWMKCSPHNLRHFNSVGGTVWGGSGGAALLVAGCRLWD